MAAHDPREIYGTTFDCECGRSHTIAPELLVFESGAAERMPEAAARATEGRRCALLFDARTREVAGARVAAALREAGWDVSEILVEDPSPGQDPVCDDETHASLMPKIAGHDLVVPVGSGVINDLGKWLSHEHDVPFVSFATAASMNGYTSANVAPKIAGVKSLVRARPPVAVLSEPEVIAGAPAEMTVSGLGDVLAKSVSSADWAMNELLFGDYFCPRSVSLVADLEPLYFERPEAIRDRDDDAISAMFDALMLTGVAMTMVGTSAPASGGEHLVSHSLDMMSSVDGQPHDFHGRQVGVGTILCSALYAEVLALESPEFSMPEGGIDRELWGPLADEVASKYAEKRERLESAVASLRTGDTWDRLRARLAPFLRTPERIQGCLAAAGGAVKAAELGCDQGRLRTAFAHGHEIRSRFTVLDLARIVGLMPGRATALVRDWA